VGNPSIEEALDAKYLIVSIMGPHAHDTPDAIFDIKQRQIETFHKCYWLHHSAYAKPETVRMLCAEARQIGQLPHCVLITPSSPHAARDTKSSAGAREFSVDRIWPGEAIPEGLRPTGVGKRPVSYALVFDRLAVFSKEKRLSLDLREYSRFEPLGLAIDPRNHGTVCAVHEGPRSSIELKTPVRNAWAVARLTDPFAGFVR